MATRALEVFLAAWAKRLSWREVGVVFGFSWERVFRSVQSVVAYSLAHRDLSGIGAIGVDEVAYRKGHQYLTLVYQIDAPGSGCRRLLHVAEGRTLRSLMSFFVMMRRAGWARGRDLLAGIGFVCSDMWKPYLRVIGKMLPQAVHILDRYHIYSGGDEPEQGVGPGAGGGGEEAEGGGLRASPEADALVPAQAEGEPDGEAAGAAA